MPASQFLPEITSPVYCSDEDMLVYCRGDYPTLCPSWQQMAFAQDGVISAGSPWLLQSASINFEALGVTPNQVLEIKGPSQFIKGYPLFATDAVAGNTVLLRRPHLDLYIGQPPSLVDVTSVSFVINTMYPQIEDATFEIKRRFGIDETIQTRTSSWIFDLRDLRKVTTLSVLYEAYSQESRTDRGDFENKAKRIFQQLDDVMARVQVRWGPYGVSNEPSTLFGCKLTR